MRTIRIATRRSDLALWQARHVAGLVTAAEPAVEVVMVEIDSEGDRDRTTPLAEMGGVGVFTRSIQAPVLDGSADLAVHSAKDLPTARPAGLVIGAVPARGHRADALVSGGVSFDRLPPGATIATSSPRRRAFLSALRTDLRFVEIRGNVPTRLARRAAGEVDAVVLARAGLVRLGRADEISEVFGPDRILPAAGQGALAIECREDDELARRILARIEAPADRRCLDAERALLEVLEAGCHLPIGVWTSVDGDRLEVEGGVAGPGGERVLRRRDVGSLGEAEELGRRVARALLEGGARQLLAS